MQEPLSVEEVRQYEKRLKSLLDSLSQEVRDVESETLEPSGETRLQPSDEAIEATSLDSDLDVLAAADEQGYAIRYALERIGNGKYGRCVTCDQAIARSRLDIVPQASQCAECARASTRTCGHRRGHSGRFER